MVTNALEDFLLNGIFYAININCFDAFHIFSLYNLWVLVNDIELTINSFTVFWEI